MKTVKYLNIAAALVLAALFFSSCYTERKATSDVGKAAVKYPAVVAAACVKYFPVKLTGSDTTHEIDSVDVYIECPPSETELSEISPEDYFPRTPKSIVEDPVKIPTADKKNNPPAATEKRRPDSVKIRIPLPKTTITNRVKDNRTETICEAEKAKLAKQLATYKTQMTIGYSLAAAFLLITIFFIIKRRA